MRGESRQNSGTFLVAQWLRFHLSVQRLGVWTLVRELRSHMPYIQKKKKPEKRNKILTNSKMIHLKKLLKKKYRIGSSFELGVMTERRAGLGRPESFQGRRGVSGRRSKQCLLQHWGEVGTSAQQTEPRRPRGWDLRAAPCTKSTTTTWKLSRAVFCFALLRF